MNQSLKAKRDNDPCERCGFKKYDRKYLKKIEWGILIPEKPQCQKYKMLYNIGSVRNVKIFTGEWREIMLDARYQEQILEEYKGYLHDLKMNDYVFQCMRIDPHVIHGAQVMLDGNQWCCILGDLATGVAGFGDTPQEACAEFDRIWREGIK